MFYRVNGRAGIAEMPFIATDEAYRRNGISRLLMGVIESVGDSQLPILLLLFFHVH